MFHHLRHNCGNNLAEADAPAPVIKAVLRHGDLSTSQQYIADVDTKRQREWMARSQTTLASKTVPVVVLPPADGGGVGREEGLREAG